MQGDLFATFCSRSGILLQEDRIIFVELCAGSAALSAAVEQSGITVVPIDCDRNRHSTLTKVHILDLTVDHSWLIWITSDGPDLMSFGTWDCPAEHAARLARYRLQVRLDHLHFEDGSTLWVFRGTQQPTDIKSYRLTNCTRRAFDFAMKLVEDGAPFTIENPTGSWVWELPFAKKLYSHCFFVDFHACMFGSTRRKRTSLLTSHACFLALRKFCDNSHTHDAWELDQYGKFNTAKEAQYPAQFCQAYAKILDNTFSDQLVATTAGATEEMPDQNSNVCDPLHLRPFHQPRGRKIPQLVPEFLTHNEGFGFNSSC